MPVTNGFNQSRSHLCSGRTTASGRVDGQPDRQRILPMPGHRLQIGFCEYQIVGKPRLADSALAQRGLVADEKEFGHSDNSVQQPAAHERLQLRHADP